MADTPQEPRLRRDRHPHAGPRDRRHDDDLHRRQRRAAAAAPLSRAGSARQSLGRFRRRRAVAPGDVAGGLPRLPGAEPIVRDAGCRLGGPGGGRDGSTDGARRRTRARRCVARHRELSPAPRRGSDLRTPLHHRGRDAGRTQGGHSEPRAVDAPLRRRSQNHRRADPPGRPRSDRCRRDARRVPALAAVGSVPDHRLADLEAAAVQLREPAAAQLHVLHGVRPAQAGRDLRAGAGGPARDRPAAARRARRARGSGHADPRRAAAGRRGQARAAGARGAVRGRRVRAAHRVRERRSPAPRAGDGAGARDGGARRARRQPRAAPPSALDGKPGARRRRRARRDRDRGTGHARADVAQPLEPAAPRRRAHRRRRAAVRRLRQHVDGGVLRPGSGPARRGSRSEPHAARHRLAVG